MLGQFVQRDADVVELLVQLRVVGARPGGCDAGADGEEALLRAVVQVAFQAPPFDKIKDTDYQPAIRTY